MNDTRMEKAKAEMAKKTEGQVNALQQEVNRLKNQKNNGGGGTQSENKKGKSKGAKGNADPEKGAADPQVGQEREEGARGKKGAKGNGKGAKGGKGNDWDKKASENKTTRDAFKWGTGMAELVCPFYFKAPTEWKLCGVGKAGDDQRG